MSVARRDGLLAALEADPLRPVWRLIIGVLGVRAGGYVIVALFLGYALARRVVQVPGAALLYGVAAAADRVGLPDRWANALDGRVLGRVITGLGLACWIGTAMLVRHLFR